MKFAPFGKNLDCPVCEKPSRDCRYSVDDETFVFCQNHSDAKKGEHINGYRCLKEANGHTASFKLDNRDEWQKLNSKAKKAKKIELAAKEKSSNLLKYITTKRRIESEMDASDRNYWFNRLISELTLKDTDRARLLLRGFTEDQIDAAGYRSIPAGYKPIAPLPKDFPGMSAKGSLSCCEGVLLPIRDSLGRIVAANIHVAAHVIAKDPKRGKYSKLSCSDSREHLNGEIVVGVELQSPTADKIYLIEGGGYKAKLAAIKHNIAVLAPSAGDLAASPVNALEALQASEQKYGSKLSVVIVPDGGDISKPKVLAKWERQYKWLTTAGYDCQFAWWGQLEKVAGSDIDEIENLSKLTYLTAEEFFTLAPKTEEVPAQPFSPKAESIKKYNAQGSKCDDAEFKTNKKITVNNPKFQTPIIEEWIERQRYTPDIKVNQKEFSLLAIPGIPLKGSMILVKSPLGSGKTKALLDYIKTYQFISIWLSYINNLLLNTGGRADSLGIKLYHIHNDDGRALVADAYAHIMACINSLKHIDGYFKGKTLILDEICSVLTAAVDGGTLGSSQGEIIAMLTKACQDADTVICLDANLSDIQAEFMNSLDPSKKFIRIENIHKAPQKQYRFVECVKPSEDGEPPECAFEIIENNDGKEDEEPKGGDYSAMIKMIQNTSKCFVTADSKRKVESIVEMVIKKDEENRKDRKDKKDEEKPPKAYGLTSRTAPEESMKEFLKSPDAFISKYRPDLFAMSPTGGSGINGTISGYFDRQFHFFCGMFSTNQQLQIMARMRDNVPINYVACPQKSYIKKRNSPKGFYANIVEKVTNDYRTLSAELANEDIRDNFIKALTRLDNRWCKLSSSLIAIDNIEQENLRTCLQWKLLQEGHEVREVVLFSSVSASSDLKEAKEIVTSREAQELFDVEEFATTLEAEQAIKKSDSVINHLKARKTYFLERIPGIKDTPQWSSEFIKEFLLNDPRYISSIQKNWMLNNLAVSSQWHNQRMKVEATREFPVAKGLSKSDNIEINALDKLGIQRLFDIEFNKNSVEVLDICKKIRTDKKIQTGLNITIPVEKEDGSDRMNIIERLLNIIGKKKSITSQKTSDDVKLRHYKVEDIDHEIEIRPNDDEPENWVRLFTRQTIYDCLSRKWEEWQIRQEKEANKNKNEEVEARRRELEKIDELRDEWARAASNSEINLEWLKSDSIANIKESLQSVDSQKMYEELSDITPPFAMKAAISTLEKSEIEKIITFGAYRVSQGAYSNWQPSRELNEKLKIKAYYDSSSGSWGYASQIIQDDFLDNSAYSTEPVCV